MTNKFMKLLHRCIKSDYFPFFVLAFCYLLFSMLVPIPIADDIHFQSYPEGIFDWSFYKLRYEIWTSRLIIDFLVVLFLHIPSVLWRISNALVIVLLGVTTSKLFINQKKRRFINWFLVSLLLLFPLKELTDTGWITTTINYFWPLAFGMYPLLLLKKINENETISCVEFCVGTLLLMIAANQEVVCIILFITFLVAAVLLRKKGNSHWFVYLGLIVLVSGVLLIFTTPGNYQRRISELKWFIDFNHISLIDKLEIGISSTLAYQIYQFNPLFLILALLFVPIIIKYYKERFFWFISFFPLIAALFFNSSLHFSANIFPNLQEFFPSLTKYGFISLRNFIIINSYIPLFILLVTAFTILILLYLTFGHTNSSILAIYIISMGFISRMAISFFPIVWASGTRTHTFLTYSILLCCLMVFQKFDEVMPDFYSQGILVFSGLFSSLTYINLIMSM